MLLHHSHIYMNDECSVVFCAAYVVFFDTMTYVSVLSVEGCVHIFLRTIIVTQTSKWLSK